MAFKTPEADAARAAASSFKTPEADAQRAEQEAPGLGLMGNLNAALNLPLDVRHTGLPLKETAEGLGAAEDLAQEGAGLAAEGGGRATRLLPNTPSYKTGKVAAFFGVPEGTNLNPQTVAGAVPGVPFAQASLGLGAIKGLVPTKVSDVGMILATEGAGNVLGKALPVAKNLLAEQPVGNVAKLALKAAADLGVPLGLDEVANTKAFSALGALLRKYPMTAPVMEAFAQARNEALVAARQRVLDQFVPAKGRPDLGAQAAQDAAGALGALDASREGAYASRRAVVPAVTVPAKGVSVTRLLPGGLLPEAAAARTGEAAVGNKLGAKSLDRSLYQYADAALVGPKAVRPTAAQVQAATDAIQVNRAPAVAAGEAVLASKGGKPLVESPAYRIAKRLTEENLDPEAEAIIRQKVSGEVAHMLRKNPAAAKSLPPEIQAALAGSDKMTMTQLSSHIDELSTELSKAKATSGGDFTPEARHLLQMKQALEGIRKDFFMNQGGEAARRYAVADAFHGDYVDVFRNPKLKGLFAEDPSGTVDAVLSGGNPEDIRRLMTAVGPGGAPQVKAALMEKVFGPATINAQDHLGQLYKKVNVPMVADVADRLSQYGPALRGVLTPPELMQWTNFAKTGAEPLFLRSEFENRMRALVASRNDAQIANAMLGGDAFTAQAGKKFLAPATFDDFRAQLAHELLSGNAKNNFARYSDEFLNTYFTPAQLKGMKTVGEAQRLLPEFKDLANAPAAKANAAIQWSPIVGSLGTTAGALAGELTGKGLTGTALGAAVGGAFTLSTRNLAKLFTTESGQQILTTLMRIDKLDPRLPKVLTRLAQMGLLEHSAMTDAKIKPRVTARPDPAMRPLGGQVRQEQP